MTEELACSTAPCAKSLTANPTSVDQTADQAQDRRKILLLALPVFGQLVAEPIAILIKTAIVGHISDASLAGLSVGTTIVFTTVGLCVFLTYSITAQVAQLMGAGRQAEGLRAGINGLWLSLIIGGGIALVVGIFSGQLCLALGARQAVLEQASLYTRALALSIPGALLAYAACGFFRGLFALRLPLVVGIVGALLNTGLDLYFVYDLHWGITGPGLAISASQWLMGGILTWAAARRARAEGVSLAPQLRGVLTGAKAGLPLFFRSLALRAALVTTVAAAAHLGTVVLASYHAINSVWVLTLNMLDAVGIAGQSVVGAAVGRFQADQAKPDHPLCHLGERHSSRVRALTCLSARTGLLVGVGVGLLLIVLSYPAARCFSPNPDIRQLAMLGIIVVGLFCPLQGWVWSLEGILIGAGDGRYLALATVLASAVYIAAINLFTANAHRLRLGGPLVHSSGHQAGTPLPLWDAAFLLLGLWAIYNLCFMGVRAIASGWRVRQDAWL